MISYIATFNIHNKNDAFTVEGVNADLRYYIPALAGHSRFFPGKLENLLAILTACVCAGNRFGLQKARFLTITQGSNSFFSL